MYAVPVIEGPTSLRTAVVTGVWGFAASSNFLVLKPVFSYDTLTGESVQLTLQYCRYTFVKTRHFSFYYAPHGVPWTQPIPRGVATVLAISSLGPRLRARYNPRFCRDTSDQPRKEGVVVQDSGRDAIDVAPVLSQFSRMPLRED